MGKLRSGILGHLSGKVAGVVGSRWKNISTLREYVIPANPDTTVQQLYRGRMRDSVAFCKQLVGPIFNVYVDKFQKSMSGFNYFISQNISKFDGTPDWPTIKIAWGKLWPAQVTYSVIGGDLITISWAPTSYGSNGSASDKVYACAFDPISGIWKFAAVAVTRSVGVITIPGTEGWAGLDIETYTLAAKYSLTSPTLLDMVSDSIHARYSGA